MSYQTHGIILIVISLLEVAIALYIFIKNPRNEIRRWYSFLIFSAAVWVWTIGGVIFVNQPTVINFIVRLTWLSPVLIASSFLFFSWVFPYKTEKITTKHWLTFALPVVIFIFLLFTPIFPVIKSVNLDPWRMPILGPGIHLFNAFFLVYWIWGLNNLFKKYISSDGINRWMLKYLLLGFVISSISGVVFNLILPWFGTLMTAPAYSAIGAELSIVWMAFTTYVLFKQKV